MGYSLALFLIFIVLTGGAVVGIVLFVSLTNLTRQLRELSRRVAYLETSTRPAPTPSAVPPTPPPVAPPGTPPPAPPPVPEFRPPPRPTAPRPPAKKIEWNIETLIGGRWLNRIGVTLVIIGVAFFLKHAFDNRWIGETGRVIIGLIAGLIFLGLGEWYRRKEYKYFSQGLTGGGIAILYLSIYAAFAFYQLIPQAAAFTFMIFVTAASVTLAVWYNAIPIASLATLGGFLTPFLLSTGVDNQAVLFSYILMLNAGILAVAYFRNWPLLNYQSFMFTVFAVATWAARFYSPEKLWPTAFFLTLFFALFAMLAILYNVVNRRKATPPEMILAFINAGLYFGTMYFLLEDRYDDYLGLFSLAMAGVYVALAYLTNLRNEDDRFLVWVFLGLAATFVTLAVPIQLKQNWITVGWALEGAVLAYISYRHDSRNTRLIAVAILTLVFFRLISLDLVLSRQYVKAEFMLLFNKRVFSYIVGIAAMALSAYFFAAKKEAMSPENKFIAGGLLIAANLLAIVLLSAEAYDYFRYLHFQNRIPRSVLRYGQQLSLSIIWTLYSASLIAIGIRKGYRPIRYMALALFAITVMKVFFVDLAALARFYRIMSFVVLGIILIGVSFLYQKYKDVLLGPAPEEEEAQ